MPDLENNNPQNEEIRENPDEDTVLDANKEPGLLEGPFIPPVAMTGPSAGLPGGAPATGTGLAPFPVPAVPVLGEEGIESGNLANPFTPADPNNEAPFTASTAVLAGIPAAVEREISADGRFRSARINVSVEDGNVVLRGTVPSENLREDLEASIRRIPGAPDVINEITIA